VDDYDYMAIPDIFFDEWANIISGNQYKLMFYIMGRMVKNPENSYTISIKELSEKILVAPNVIDKDIKVCENLNILKTEGLLTGNDDPVTFTIKGTKLDGGVA
jgi:hypothetical protein